ncbi:MAG TPA: DUF932 domain-containing protein [Lacipirellulaceae bacterium]|nr:DUF932 domain-containing protein [Lacipirellulaceae bacterium]
MRERGQTVGPHSISNLALLDEVVEELRSLPWQFHVDHCREHDGDLHVAVFASDLGRNLELGDRVHAGFFLQNSEKGAFATLACERLFRVACENGALIECEKGQSLEISSSGRPREWKTQLQTVIARSFSADGLDLDLARFHATTQQMLLTPYELLCNLVAQQLIDADEQSQIQAAFDDAADFTMYGLINAVTQVAHRHRKSDAWIRAFQLERLGGEILRGDHNLPAWELART